MTPLIRFPCSGNCVIHSSCLQEIFKKPSRRRRNEHRTTFKFVPIKWNPPVQGKKVHDILHTRNTLMGTLNLENSQSFQSDFILALNMFSDFLWNQPSWSHLWLQLSILVTIKKKFTSNYLFLFSSHSDIPFRFELLCSNSLCPLSSTFRSSKATTLLPKHEFLNLFYLFSESTLHRPAHWKLISAKECFESFGQGFGRGMGMWNCQRVLSLVSIVTFLTSFSRSSSSSHPTRNHSNFTTDYTTSTFWWERLASLLSTTQNHYHRGSTSPYSCSTQTGPGKVPSR